MSMEFEMFRSFNNNYELLCYITNTINPIPPGLFEGGSAWGGGGGEAESARGP